MSWMIKLCELAALLTDLWCTAVLLTTKLGVQLCEQKSIADEPTHYNEMVLSELLMLAYYGVHACSFVSFELGHYVNCAVSHGCK